MRLVQLLAARSKSQSKGHDAGRASFICGPTAGNEYLVFESSEMTGRHFNACGEDFELQN
jgi:hypothetical protein